MIAFCLGVVCLAAIIISIIVGIQAVERRGIAPPKPKKTKALVKRKKK